MMTSVSGPCGRPSISANVPILASSARTREARPAPAACGWAPWCRSPPGIPPPGGGADAGRRLASGLSGPPADGREPEEMNMLAATAAALVAPGKGILAADESIPTMSARLQRAGVPPAAGRRRACREMLVTTPGLCRGISGVILCAETLSQRLPGGRPFPAAIRELGMLPGIKADAGTRPLPGTAGETVTEGLDGLADRLRLYAEAGAVFAKWRAVFRIGAGSPSAIAVRANAQALARYAAACQEAGLVPVVEPEVLMAGDHSLSQCEAVTSLVLLQVSSELQDYGVDFGAVVLKPNMVLPGSDSPERATPGQAAAATAAALGALPAAL